MGVPKGTPKHPNVGRKKGTPNKRSDSAAETLEQLGFNGLAEMYRMYSDPALPEMARVKLLAEMTQYQYPKRKALEHSGELKEHCTLTITGV